MSEYEECPFTIKKYPSQNKYLDYSLMNKLSI